VENKDKTFSIQEKTRKKYERNSKNRLKEDRRREHNTFEEVFQG